MRGKDDRAPDRKSFPQSGPSTRTAGIAVTSAIRVQFFQLQVENQDHDSLRVGLASYSNSSITISGFDPNRNGGPQVPAPLDVKTCIFPIWLKPYTNCR